MCVFSGFLSCPCLWLGIAPAPPPLPISPRKIYSNVFQFSLAQYPLLLSLLPSKGCETALFYYNVYICSCSSATIFCLFVAIYVSVCLLFQFILLNNFALVQFPQVGPNAQAAGALKPGEAGTSAPSSLAPIPGTTPAGAGEEKAKTPSPEPSQTIGDAQVSELHRPRG